MSGGQNAVNAVNGGSSSTFRNGQKLSSSSNRRTAGWTPAAEETSTMEMKELNGKDGGTARIDSLHIHLNPIIKLTENCRLCQCSKRWQLAILANLGFLIVFGIRCNFGAAKNHMSRDYIDPWGKKHKHSFNWTSAELGVMESSFFYGYLITQIPAGFLAAKFPANKMFGLAIGGASFLNILLPYAFHSRSDSMIALVQIAQGLVQGLAYPAMHGVWRYWAPPLERSKLATTAFTGSYAGAVFGLPLSAWLVSYVHWSTPFYIYGIAGCIWAIFWFGMTFEKPTFHPTISAQEKAYIEGAIGHVSQSHPTLSTVPWRQIFISKPVWAIIVANFARSWNFYLLLQNQLTYMRDVLGLRINDSGFIAALPHAVMGCVVLTGGRLADYLRSNKILSTTAVRKIFNCGGFGCEALFLLIVAYTRSERTAMIALIIAVGCSGFAISGFNVNHLDIAPRYAAILMGFSNGIGTLAGLICPFVVESLTSKGNPNGWVTVFLLASLIHFTGITFYAVYASGELQDWAEPKEGEEEERIAWNAEKAAQARAMDEAGKRKSSYGAVGTVKFDPFPAQIAGMAGDGGAADAYYQQQSTAIGPTTNHQNPFVAAWGDDGQQPQYSQYSSAQNQPTWTTEDNVQSNNISSAQNYYHHQY